MAKQINTKVTAPTPELSESTELNKAEHAETGAGIEKQADNASEEPEKPSETEPGHEPEEQQGPGQDKVQAAGVLVKYIGASIWRDEEGKYWASEKKSDNILTERQFTAKEYDKRGDIKFMVQYGEMKATELYF